MRSRGKNIKAARLSEKWWGLMLIVAALATMTGSVRTKSVPEKIEDILAGPHAQSAFWGVHVKDLSSGRVMYTRNGNKTFVPASNQKLLTSAAALDALGADFRYETTLHFKGEIGGSVLKGDLILEGAGDPTFSSKEFKAENPLKEWAEKLAGLGVTRIEGRIIGDDNVFDDQPYAEGWDLSFIATESFAPASSGLSGSDNVVVVQIESSRVGAAPVLTDKPGGYLDIDNKATTSARRRGRSIRVNRKLGTEEVSVKGSVPRVYRRSVIIPVSNPTLFTLHTFRNHLAEAGIEVVSTLYDIDELDENIDYKNAAPLFVYHSPMLSDVLVQINKESNNFYAEQVFRTFGWGGSVEGGERRVKDFLKKADVSRAGLSVRDGSGLSRKNMLTTETIGGLLAYMQQHPEWETFKRTLARGGEAQTTLDHRLKGIPVYAKTGSLESVRSLSGYVTTRDGRLIAFSLIANNYTVPSYRIMQAMDKIVLAITEGDEA
ncbi:MAG: D-alanyl-D-alanine carboxypeptidase/D-alanyl-D-alanine-endopeptidase [Rhodothermales bacterium]